MASPSFFILFSLVELTPSWFWKALTNVTACPRWKDVYTGLESPLYLLMHSKQQAVHNIMPMAMKCVFCGRSLDPRKENKRQNLKLHADFLDLLHFIFWLAGWFPKLNSISSNKLKAVFMGSLLSQCLSELIPSMGSCRGWGEKKPVRPNQVKHSFVFRTRKISIWCIGDILRHSSL